MLSAQVREAELARRALVVRGVAATFMALSAAAAGLSFALDNAPGVAWVNLAAIGGFAAALILGRRGRAPRAAPVVLLGTMPAQHVLSGLSVPNVEDIGSTMAFTALIPPLAAATLGVRGTIVTAVIALVAEVVVLAASASRGFEPVALANTLAPPIFAVFVAGTIAVLSSVAARRSLAAQSRQEQATAKAEDSALAAEARFRLVADEVSDLVAMLDADGRFTFASAAYEPVLGVRPATLMGRPSAELVHPDDAPALERARSTALRGEHAEATLRLRAHDGEHRTFHVRLAGLEVEQRPYVAMMSRDITELQAQNAVRESSRRMDALGRLAGGVAHDFNNLLSVIGGCAAMIRMGVPQTHESVSDLDIIDDAVVRAGALTGQLLGFARRQVLAPGRAAPGAVVRQVAPLLERAGGSGVKIELDVDGSRWETAMSAGQLEQILMNLTVNARDAMPRGGTVRIRVVDVAAGAAGPDAEVPGDHVLVEVRDSGSGMPPEVVSRVF